MVRYENTILNPTEICYAALMIGNTVMVCFSNGSEHYIECKSKAEAVALIDDIVQATKYKFD